MKKNNKNNKNNLVTAPQSDIKRVITRVIIFIAAFAGTYLALSFGVPDMALKEIKDPNHAFVETLQYMALSKILYSFAIAFFLSYAPRVLDNYKANKLNNK